MNPRKRQKLHRQPASGVTASEPPVTAAPSSTVASPSQQAPSHRQLLIEAEVCSRLRRHRSSVWRDVKNRVVPAPVRIGRSVLWYADEIDSFVANLRRTTESE